MKFNITYITLYILLSCGAKAQTAFQEITFGEYLDNLKEKNLNLAAQKYDISISEASILTAGIFPDPQIDIETSNNGVSADMGYTISAGVSWTLELGKKRKARINLAKNETEYAKLQFQDYLRNLVADATLGYIEALKSKTLLEVLKSSYENTLQLAKSDSIRYKLGDISKVTSQQSRLEASSLLNEVYQQESDAQQTITSLSDFTGNDMTEKMIVGSLTSFNRNFNLEELIAEAMTQRADLLATKQNVTTAKSLINLEKANRVIDLGLSVTTEHSTVANNEIAPSPAVNAVKLGVSIPLKFSNRRNGDLKIAEFKHLQAEVETKRVENIIRMEITQAYQHYQSTQKQIRQFDNVMLEDAKNILDGIRYSYQRGESSILEVLNAQRTYNELRKNYFEILAENAGSLVELERRTGFWDIDF